MLFGYIVGVTDAQLRLFALIALVVLVVLILLHKELELTSFDPTHAQVIGLRADRLRDVLLVLMALAVVGAIQAVGVVLTSALLIVPAAAAAMLTRRLVPMMALAPQSPSWLRWSVCWPPITWMSPPARQLC